MAFGEKEDKVLQNITIRKTPKGDYISTTDLIKMINDSGDSGPIPNYLKYKRGLFLAYKLNLCRFIERFIYNKKEKKFNLETRIRLLSLLVLGDID